jgi:hypothetical protein
MAIEKPVIVMALYDIGRDTWDHYGLSYNTYLYWMRNTLSLNANFVIYTEDKFIEDIKGMRREFDNNLEKTKIISIPLSELDCYKQYNDKLEKLMFSEDFSKKVHHPNVPEMTKPLYNIIMFNKLNFLKHTKDNNYFDSDLFIWADAGGLRDNIINYKNITYPSLDKINNLDIGKTTFFSHHSDFEIGNKEFHAMSQIRHIQGTAFFVPKESLDDLLYSFNETINECIDNNFIGSDEKIFDLTYVKNKSKYQLIQCTWREYFNLFK